MAKLTLGFSSISSINLLMLTHPVHPGSSIRISSLNSESLMFTTTQFRTRCSSCPVICPSGFWAWKYYKGIFLKQGKKGRKSMTCIGQHLINQDLGPNRIVIWNTKTSADVHCITHVPRAVRGGDLELCQCPCYDVLCQDVARKRLTLSPGQAECWWSQKPNSFSCPNPPEDPATQPHWA